MNNVHVNPYGQQEAGWRPCRAEMDSRYCCHSVSFGQMLTAQLMLNGNL